MSGTPVMLAATEFRDGATGAGLVHGFRQRGWLVQQVDRGEYFGCRGSFALRLASRLDRNRQEAAYNEAIWREAKALCPQVFFTVKGASLNPELLRRLQDLGTKLVMYYPDVNFEHPGVDKESFRYYDLFVTTKSFQLGWLRERLGHDRVAYVPHGYSDLQFQPVHGEISESQYMFDALYMGNHSPYKQAWIERLLALEPGLNLGVVGNRWQQQQRPLKLTAASFLGEVRGLALASIIQRSRINIAFHFGKAASGWEDLVSTRTFEIPACKGFMLHIDNTEVREFFEVGQEIDVFSTPEDLHTKIAFYLENQGRRVWMMERAYARAKKEYGYARRAAAIDALIRRDGFLANKSS